VQWSWVRFGPLQKAAVAFNRFFACVAGQITEGGVDVDEGTIGQVSVRKRHGHAGHLQRLMKYVLVQETLS